MANDENRYFQLVLEETNATRFQAEGVTTDTFEISIIAKSKKPISDLPAIKRQVQIALMEAVNYLDQPRESTRGVENIEEIFQALRPVMADLAVGDKRSPGRRQVRIDRIWKAMKKKKSTLITIDDLEEEFKSTRHPIKSASSAIGWLNAKLKEMGAEIRIERVTAYRAVKVKE